MHPATPASSEYTVADQERMRAARRYFGWQSRLAKNHLGRRVLEIGCGLGNFSEHLAGRELVLGIDIDESCVGLWRERFAAKPHYSSRVLDVQDPAMVQLADAAIDSIACLNVLEHVEDDRRALRNMYAVLPHGGRAVLIVPAFGALYGEIDARLGHYRRYNRRALREIAEAAGFRVQRMRFMNTIGFFGWWANARVFRRTRQSDAQIRVFDSLVVPFLSRFEACFPVPFGQSILTVLEK